MMKVSGKKDEKSTTATASMRGKWDMKRDVFLTCLSDNGEADRPLWKPYQHIKEWGKERKDGMFSDPRLERVCWELRTSGEKKKWLLCFVNLVITGRTLLFAFSVLEKRKYLTDDAVIQNLSQKGTGSTVMPESWFVQKSNQLKNKVFQAIKQ